MLSYAVLATLCLGALWLAALLVAAAAWGEARALGALGARLRPLPSGESGVGLLEGEVEEGGGADGAFANHAIVQVGRAIDGREAVIVFRDRRYASRVSGGVVRVGGARPRVAPCAEDAAVWTTRRARQEAAACVGADAFEAAYAAARTPRGFLRSVATAIRAGDRVFICGEVVPDGDVHVVRAPSGGELLVATRDPRRFVRRHRRLVAAFIAGDLFACALCTTLAVWPPAFGRVGTVGGALCLAFFLGVTPLGVWLRDRCRPPDRGLLHGVWTRPGAAPR